MWAPRERCCTKGMPTRCLRRPSACPPRSTSMPIACGSWQVATRPSTRGNLCRRRAPGWQSTVRPWWLRCRVSGGSATKRQQLLELGEPAIRYLTELVHRRPRGWWVDVDRLHNLLQSHGPEVLGEAMEEGLNEQRFDVSFVEEFLQGKLNFSEEVST